MLKKLVPLAVILLLGALSAAAEPVCGSNDDLAWLLAPVAPAPEAALVTETSPLDLASVQRTGSGAYARCSVSASCGSYSINCSVAGSGCSGHDRACPDFQGHVTCNGVTTWCDPVCPSDCTPAQCRQPCKMPGCVAVCVDLETCECESICGP